MNTKDAEILVNAEDAVGLYASPLLSPIESSPTLLSKGKNSYKIQKKPKVPYYLRESLPKKCHRPAKNVVSALPENSERPSSSYMDSVMEKVWDKMQKRQTALKQAKGARGATQMSVSGSLNPRKSHGSSSFFVSGKPQPPSRFQKYKSFFCEENIEKVRIQTSAPDRRASVRAFGKDAIIFQARRFNQESEHKLSQVPSLPGARTEQALSSILPTVPPADVSPAILNKIESPATLYSVHPKDKKIKLNPITTQPPFQAKLESSPSYGEQPGKKPKKKKQQSGILTTILSGVPSGQESKEELLSSRRDHLSDVLNRSNEQSMLSFLNRERSKALSQEKENILVEPAQMFNSSFSHTRKQSQASASPYREMSRVNSNQKKVRLNNASGVRKAEEVRTAVQDEVSQPEHSRQVHHLAEFKSIAFFQRVTQLTLTAVHESASQVLQGKRVTLVRRGESEYENEKQGAVMPARGKKKLKPMRPERLIQEIAKKAHDFILLQKKRSIR